MALLAMSARRDAHESGLYDEIAAEFRDRDLTVFDPARARTRLGC